MSTMQRTSWKDTKGKSIGDGSVRWTLRGAHLEDGGGMQRN